MVVYEYFTHTVYTEPQLNSLLNERGQEGWRLHTCDINSYSGLVSYLVVMDRAYESEQPVEEEPGVHDGIEMKAGPS